MSWLRGACTSCDRAPASERGAWTFWLLDICASMAFADATSAGQEVCAIPAVAERETADTILNTVASVFLICVILSQVGSCYATGRLLPVPHLAQRGTTRCLRVVQMGCHWLPGHKAANPKALYVRRRGPPSLTQAFCPALRRRPIR